MCNQLIDLLLVLHYTTDIICIYTFFFTAVNLHNEQNITTNNIKHCIIITNIRMNSTKFIKNSFNVYLETKINITNKLLRTIT